MATSEVSQPNSPTLTIISHAAPSSESDRRELTSARRLPRDVSGTRAIGWWGTIWLIANEAVLFAALIAGYFYLRFNFPVWPPRGIEPPELAMPLVGTVILLSSSVAMGWGEAGIRRGDLGRLRLGLLVACVLAVVFLGIQAFEYSRVPFIPQENMYTALFFTITGLHMLHLIVAVVANIVVQIEAGLNYFTQDRHLAIQNVALYWHFVDIVWIVVFLAVYVSPRL